jgi:hypothetical protein
LIGAVQLTTAGERIAGSDELRGSVPHAGTTIDATGTIWRSNTASESTAAIYFIEYASSATLAKLKKASRKTRLPLSR